MVKAVRVMRPDSGTMNLSGFMSNREMDYWMDGFWACMDMARQKLVMTDKEEDNGTDK